jgi:hypothetical protein
MDNLPAPLTASTSTNRVTERWPNRGSVSWFASGDRSPTARSRSPSSLPTLRPTHSVRLEKAVLFAYAPGGEIDKTTPGHGCARDRSQQGVGAATARRLAERVRLRRSLPGGAARSTAALTVPIRAGTCRGAKGARERGLPRPYHLMRKVETFVADWLSSLIVTFTFSSLPFAFFGIINDRRATPALNCSALGSTFP